MILNDDFFDELPSDKLEVGIKICRAITKFDSDLKDAGAKFGAYYDYLDALGALTAFVQENPKGFIDLIAIRYKLYQLKIYSMTDVPQFHNQQLKHLKRLKRSQLEMIHKPN